MGHPKARATAEAFWDRAVRCNLFPAAIPAAKRISAAIACPHNAMVERLEINTKSWETFNPK